MCNCIGRIDGELKAEDQCLDATMFGHRKATMMLIRKDKWKHENRRKKPTRIIATHCPFCGEKYPIGDRVAPAVASQGSRGTMKINDIIEAMAKTIWLAEFERAFGRVPSDPWENQADKIKVGHRNTARKLIESGVVGDLEERPAAALRAMTIEECANILDECAQDWRKIRDPGMANNAVAYAKRIRALAVTRPDGNTGDLK